MDKKIKDFTFADLYGLLDGMILYSGDLESSARFINGYDGFLDGGVYIHRFYIISESDAEFLRKTTTLPVLYDTASNIYLYGQTFCGVSPKQRKAVGYLTDEGVRFLIEDQGYIK